MHILIGVAWVFWGIAVMGLVSKRLARTLVFSRALKCVVRKPSDILNLHELRILKNKGDWRDPIERNQGAIAEINTAASLVVVAIALTFSGFLFA